MCWRIEVDELFLPLKNTLRSLHIFLTIQKSVIESEEISDMMSIRECGM